MALNFLLDVADRSEKWYIRPGETKTFDLIARNNSDKLTRCLLTVLEPRTGINIEPTTFTLAAAQHVRAQLKLHAPATMGDDMRVILKLSTKEGALLASFERRVANAQPDDGRSGDGAAALFSIEPADRAGRWYVTPGSASRYELRVRNAGSSAGAVSITLDQPADYGSIDPAEFSVGPRESKTVHLTFERDAKVLIGQRAVVTVRAPSGKPLATFERELYAASDTDCAVSLSLARVSVDGDGKRAEIVLACSVKSLSQGPGTFPLDFNTHPSLTWPPLAPLELEPGQTKDFEIPVAWDSSREDASGFNHPRALEVGIGVSYGRRSAKVMWEAVRSAIQAQTKTPEPAPQPAAVAAAAASTALMIVPRPVEATPAAESAPTAVAGAPPISPAPPADDRPGQPPAAPAAAEPHSDAALRDDDYLSAYGAPPERVLTPGRRPRTGMRMPVIALIFLGVGLLVVAAFFWLQPTINASREGAAVGPAPLPSAVLQTLPPVQSSAKPRTAASHKSATAVAAQPSAAATRSPGATTAPTAAPTARPTPRMRRTTVAPAPKRIASPAAHNPAPHRPTARPRVNTAALIAMDGLDAQFVLGGRAVRVAWNASAQSSADVQLINDHGKIVTERKAGPFKRNMLIYLPPRYRGGIVVQLVGYGYHGERVSQTASLTPFGQ